MKRYLAICIAAAVIGTLFVGCTQRIGDFTVISSKNVEIGGKYKKLDGRFEGVDAKPIILGIPIGNPDLKQAVDNCIEAGKGDFVANAVLEYAEWQVIIFGQRKYKVIGDVWAKASTSDLMNPQIELYELQQASDGYRMVSLADPAKSVKVESLYASR